MQAMLFYLSNGIFLQPAECIRVSARWYVIAAEQVR